MLQLKRLREETPPGILEIEIKTTQEDLVITLSLIVF